jgi:hypothetical protein
MDELQSTFELPRKRWVDEQPSSKELSELVGKEAQA